METSVTYWMVAGATAVIDPSLAYVTILGVKREGLGYTQKTVIGNRAFVYTTALGKIEFENPFGGNLTNDLEDEKVFVLYKY